MVVETFAACLVMIPSLMANFIGYQFNISLICAQSLEHAEGYL